MAEVVSVNFVDIAKVGLVCFNCGSEIVVNLEKANPERIPPSCPACYAKDEHGVIQSTGAPPFTFAQAWVKQVQDLKQRAKGIRLYFNKPE